MEIPPPKSQQPNIPPVEPKRNWFIRHEHLYIVIGVLLLVVIVGSAYWWQEIKKQTVSSKQQTETIAGIDADNNGIRDDVEQFIKENYTKPAEVESLRQYAAALHGVIVSSSNPGTAWGNVQKSEGCLIYVFGTSDVSKARTLINAEERNTKEREHAFLEANRSYPLNSQIHTSSKSDCNFDLDSLGSADTSTWKTYTNSQYGFSFKYNNSLWGEDDLTKLGTDRPLISLFNLKDLADSKNCQCGEVSRFQVWVKSNPSKLSLADFAKKTYPKDLYNLTNVTIADAKALEFGEMDHYILIENSSSVVVIKGNDKDILSTFKFTDSADTSTWKTYTNSQYRFEFKYPSNDFITDNTDTYFRIQNYSADDDKNGLGNGEFYLETSNSAEDVDCTEYLDEPVIIKYSNYTTYTGTELNQGGDAGGGRYGLCVQKAGKYYSFTVTENNEGQIANSIFSTFKFTK